MHAVLAVRLHRRRTEDLERAGSNLVENLLPVLDAFDNAMIHGIDGVAPIYKALIDVLQKEGLEVIPAEPGTRVQVALP